MAAVRIEPDSSRVFTTLKEVPFDYLIIATGSYLAFDEVSGLGPEKGYTDCIFTLPQAERTYHSWKRFLEELGQVVVGAVQGASCLGGLSYSKRLMEDEFTKGILNSLQIRLLRR